MFRLGGAAGLVAAVLGLVGVGAVVEAPPAAAAGTCASLDPFAGGWAVSYLAGLGGVHVAAAVEDVSTGCRFRLGATDGFPMVSTVKAEVLGAVLLQQQDAGVTTVPGWLAGLATPMITGSDNDATDALYDDIGGAGALQAGGRRLGLNETDNTSYDWGGSATTPDDQLALLQSLLIGGGALGPAGVAYARSLMSSIDPAQAWGVSAGAPAGASVFLKNGWLFNDGTSWGPGGLWRVNSIGMVQLANGRQYTIAVYGNEWSTMGAGVAAIEWLSRHVASVLAAPRTGGQTVAGAIASVVAAPSASTPSLFTAMSPTRLLDTRTAASTGGRPVPSGGEVVVDVAAVADASGGQARPPGSTLTAAALNVTAVDSAGPGFVTAYPDGVDRPLASNLNQIAGRATANIAVVPVGEDGKVRLYSSVAANLVVDLLGTWSSAPGAAPLAAGVASGVATAAGRVTMVTPTRLFDTRAAGDGLAAAAQVPVPMAGRAGVPASGASAVVVNVTATNTTRAGYWTVWPGDAPRPLASNLNTVAGETASNTTIVPVAADGSISVYAQGGGDVVVDVLGWVTGPSSPAATAGELVTLASPTRAVDTRFGDGGLDRIERGAVVRVSLAPIGVPATAVGVAADLTYADPTADGYLTAYPAGGARPATSSANPSVIRGFGANAMVTGLSDAAFDLYASVSTDAVVDVWGWFTS